MSRAHLMTDHPVRFVFSPLHFPHECLKGFSTQSHAVTEYRNRIGFHCVNALHTPPRIRSPQTEAVVFRSIAAYAAQKPMSFLHKGGTGQQNCNRTCAACKGGNGVFEQFHILCPQKPVNGNVHHFPRGFARYQHPCPDLPQFNGICHLQHSVKHTQTRVGQIKNLGFRSQSQIMGNSAGCGRFQIVPAHAAVNQHPDVFGPDIRNCKGFSACCGCTFGNPESLIPEPSFINAGDGFQLPRFQMQAMIQRRQTAFQIP